MIDDFRYYLRVRYSECDAQKVVFNARYADYVDLAATEFLRFLGAESGLPDGEFDYQVVKLTIEWNAPARYRQALEVAVRTSYVGNTSFALTMEIRVAGEEQLIASAEMISVAVDPVTVAKTPVPPAMRDAMNRGAPGSCIDHAGYLDQHEAAAARQHPKIQVGT